MNEEKRWLGFVKLCLEFESVKDLDRFFDFFLTMEEKHLLASRYQIIKELLAGKHSQREIAKLHGVSIAQITRGSNALKRCDSKTKDYLKEFML